MTITEKDIFGKKQIFLSVSCLRPDLWHKQQLCGKKFSKVDEVFFLCFFWPTVHLKFVNVIDQFVCDFRMKWKCGKKGNVVNILLFCTLFNVVHVDTSKKITICVLRAAVLMQVWIVDKGKRYTLICVTHLIVWCIYRLRKQMSCTETSHIATH